MQVPAIKSSMARRVRLLAILATAGGPLLLFVGSQIQAEAGRLRRLGQTIDGEVFDSSTLSTGRGRRSHRLVIDYRPPGAPATLRKEFRGVPAATFERAIADRKIPVRYLADQPEVSTLDPDEPAGQEPALAGAALTAIALVCWLYLRHAARGKPSPRPPRPASAAH